MNFSSAIFGLYVGALDHARFLEDAFGSHVAHTPVVGPPAKCYFPAVSWIVDGGPCCLNKLPRRVPCLQRQLLPESFTLSGNQTSWVFEDG